jgi:glycerate 2-kinase
VSAGEADRAALERIFRAGVAAADPAEALRKMVRVSGGVLELAGERLPSGSGVALLAAGKAAHPMAAAFDALAGQLVSRGLSIGPSGTPSGPARYRSLGAAHPIPDASSERAGRAALDFVAGLEARETLVVLLSGGSSSLLACPAPGLPRKAFADTTQLLLEDGAPIDELNCVRKHLSALAGGRLAAATPARRVIVLVVSDVLGDRLDVIGSGPCAADPSRYADARALLLRRGLWERVPAAVRVHLEAGIAGALTETPWEDDPRVRHVVLVNNRSARVGAELAARAEGLRPLALSDRLSGEARTVGRRLGRLARSLRPDRPLCLIAGGETTVRVTGRGRGGRSQELALAAALELQGAIGITLLAAGTDGCDGPTDAAGAFADGASVARAAALGTDAAGRLRENDAYRFFAAIDGLLRTGPTGTNVMDLVLIRCDAVAPS